MKLNQIKIIGRSLALLVALACSSAWAGSDYYAALKVVVSSGSADMGKVYASDSSAAPDDGSYQATESQKTGTKNSTSSSASITLYAHAKANTGYEFTGWSESEGGQIKSTNNPYSKSISSSQKNQTSAESSPTVLYANFKSLVDAAFTVSFLAPSAGGTYTVNGSTISSEWTTPSQTLPYSTTLVATPATGYAVKGWYTLEDGTKTYFSTAATADKTFLAGTTVGVEFVPVVSVTTYSAFKTALSNSDAISIPSGVDIVVSESLSIAAGKLLIVEGNLYVEGGSLTIAGTVSGGGSISKCGKLLEQTGNGTQPLNPYGSVKYWRTTTSTTPSSTVTWNGGTVKTHLTVKRPDGTVVRGIIPSDAKLVKCTFNSSVAVNHVTAIGAASSTEQITENASYILLANTTITGPIVDDSGYTRLKCTSTIDCAGYTIGLTYKQTHSGHHPIVLNATEVSFKPSAYWQSNGATFYNCPKITVNKLKHATTFNFYDSATTLLSFSTYDTTGGANCNFYSGMYSSSINLSGTSYPFNSASGDNATCKIYGGAFQVEPADKWIVSGMQATHEFHQHDDGYYYLEPKQDPSVAQIGQTKYLTLEEAFAYLENNSSATLKLLRNCTLDQMYTLAAGKSLTIELGGCCVTAPNGFIKNYGTLAIRDNDLKTSVSGITAGSGKVVVQNEDGSVDLCYGAYTGNFVVNGGTLTTHHGSFTGSVINNGGDVNLKGGVFSTDVSSLLKDGYIRIGNTVCRFPAPVYTSSTVADFGFKLTLMSSNDKTLYTGKGNSSLSGCSSVSEYANVAELKSVYDTIKNYPIDITLKADRTVADASLQVKVKVSFTTQSENVPALEAGNLTRIVSPLIADQGASAVKISTMISDSNYSSLEAGVDNTKDANKGTTLRVAMELSNGTHPNLSTFLEIFTKSYVIGAGSKIAMLQTPSGAVPDANFYSTLAAALTTSATDGETIKLCNNCSETVTVGKTCVIDLNGFAFTGSFQLADGVEMTKNGDIHTFTYTAPSGPVYISGASASASEIVLTSSKGAAASVKESSSPTSFDPACASAASIVPSATGNAVRYFKAVEGNSLSENTLGLLRVDSKTKATIVAVPWVKLSENSSSPISVADVVMTAGLTNGDKLYAYPAGARSNSAAYQVWTLSNGAWTPVTTYVQTGTGSTTQNQAGEAVSTYLPRGSAFWLERQNANTPFYLYGQYASETVAAPTISAGTASAPVHTLLANPKLTAVSLNSLTWQNVNAADTIILPSNSSSGAQTKLTYENGSWGFWKTTKENGELRNTRETNITIPVGTGFWYVSRGGSPTINWGNN